MKTLVDEIRDMVREASARDMHPVITDAASDLLGRSCWSEEDEAELFTIIADRIEREHMPLPMLEGEPLKVGDKVDGYNQAGAEVVAIMNSEIIVVRSTVKGGNGYHDDAYPLLLWSVKDVKRTEPDSLERINDDARKEVYDYWNCQTACFDCPAKVDGKSPRERYGTRGCIGAQKLDLLRRQREVLERGQ